MSNVSSLDAFLERTHIRHDEWERAGLDWEDLRRVAADYEAHSAYHRDTAEMFARAAQRFDAVHSVRWRVKHVDHVLKKIVRKRASDSAKYADINASNYFEKITDLVGVRLLHLFKDECFSIDRQLQQVWEAIETPIAYVRSGDPDELLVRFRDHKFEVRTHDAGYRSVHYVFVSQTQKRRVMVEVQVRTIFEEGWSEIDHKVRYPDYSDERLIEYFLQIFNRLAGSADEMGTFVLWLTRELTTNRANLESATNSRDEAFSTMEGLLADLENRKKQDAELTGKIEAMQHEIAKLRRLATPTAYDGQNSLASLFATVGAHLANSELHKIGATVTAQQQALVQAADTSARSLASARQAAERLNTAALTNLTK
jgi:Uncharacterized protein conserved in bacteria